MVKSFHRVSFLRRSKEHYRTLRESASKRNQRSISIQPGAIFRSVNYNDRDFCSLNIDNPIDSYRFSKNACTFGAVKNTKHGR